MVYKASSGTARATQRNTLLDNQSKGRRRKGRRRKEEEGVVWGREVEECICFILIEYKTKIKYMAGV